MNKEMTRSDYCREVRSIAESLIKENPDADREEMEQTLWETIDGHQWVIYTAYNLEVLRHSENDDYSFQNFGAESCFDAETGIHWGRMAFGALYADVSEVLWEMFEERDVA